MIICFLGRNRKAYEKNMASRTTSLPRTCPQCRGRMHRHGSYLRGVDEPGGVTWWTRIQRMRCSGCGVTHGLLPHFLIPYARMSTPGREAVARAWVAGRACSACKNKPAVARAHSGVGSGDGGSGRCVACRGLRESCKRFIHHAG